MLPGVLKESTGGYAAGMGILAAELLMTAVIVLYLGRVMAPRTLPLPFKI